MQGDLRISSIMGTVVDNGEDEKLGTEPASIKNSQLPPLHKSAVSAAKKQKQEVK